MRPPHRGPGTTGRACSTPGIPQNTSRRWRWLDPLQNGLASGARGLPSRLLLRTGPLGWLGLQWLEALFALA